MIWKVAKDSSRFSPSRVPLALLAPALIVAGGWLGGCHQAQPDKAVAVETPTQEASAEKSAAHVPAKPEAEGASDAQGRFLVPIPEGWAAKALDGDWVQIAHPESELGVYVGVVAGADPEAAIAQTWTKWDPEFVFKSKSVVNPPASDGLEKIVVITYELEDKEQFAQAIGRQYQGHTYVFALNGSLASVQKRGAQLNVMQSSLKIAALEESDLAQAEPAEFDAAKQAQFDAYIQQQFERSDIPGAAVAVIVGDKVVYKKGFGVRQKGGTEPVGPSTLMMIGSATKSMTTSMMARLVDQGRLQWDSPMTQLMPEFKLADQTATERAQLQHMVCACTGVPRRDVEMILDFGSMTPQSMVKSLGSFELYTDFGETFQYSNQMVATGGYAAAMANGASFNSLAEGYAEAIKSQVFQPLGMSRTTIDFDRALADPDHAMPHARRLDGTTQPIEVGLERFVEPLAPAGAAWSSVEDVSRFVIAQIQEGVAPDGARWVSAENLAETHRSRVDISADLGYGLGWFVDAYKGVRVLHHGGNTGGFTAEMAFMPRAGVGIVVLTNAGAVNWFPSTLKTRLWELLYEQDDAMAEKSADLYLSERAKRLEKQRAKLENVSRDQVAKFLGAYTNADVGDLTLEYINDQLVADYGEGRLTLMHVKDEAGLFTGVDSMVSGPFEFREKDGKPSIVLGKGATTYTFTPKQ